MFGRKIIDILLQDTFMIPKMTFFLKKGGAFLFLFLLIAGHVFAADSHSAQGKVFSYEDKPVAGLSIYVYPFHSYFHPELDEPLSHSITDTEGAFTINIPEGRETIILVRDSHQVLFQKHLTPNTRYFEINIEQEPVISGIIRKKNGEPLNNALIGPLRYENTEKMPYYTWSDEEGIFHFFSLSPNEVSLIGYKNGHLPAKWKGTVPSENITITLEDNGASLTGKVVGSRSIQPLDSKNVVLEGNSFLLQTQTDSNGRFNFIALHPGEYRVFSLENGVAWSKIKEVDLDERGIANLVLEYDQGIHLAGTVKDVEHGEPVNGFTFFADRYSQPPIEVTTDRHGIFFMHHHVFEEPLTFHSPDSEYRFWVKEDAEVENGSRISFSNVSPDRDEYELEVLVQKADLLNGRVIAPDNIIETADIKVRCIDSGNNSLSDYNQIEADGSFSIPLFSHGTYYFFAYSTCGNYSSPLKSFQRNEGEGLPDSFSLIMEETGRIEIIIPDVKKYLVEEINIQAVCPDHGDTLVADFSISSQAQSKALTSLPLERIRLLISSQDGILNTRQTISFPLDDDLILQPEFEEMIPLSGHVLNSSGKPLGDVSIRVQYDSGIGRRYPVDFTSNPDGSFSISPFIADACQRITFSHPAEGEYVMHSPVNTVNNAEVVLTGSEVYNATVFESRNRLFSGELAVSLRHDEENVFNEIMVPISEGNLELTGLKEGTYHVLLEDPKTSLSYQGQWEITPDTSRLPDVLLNPAQSFWGYIYDENRRPLPDAEVILSSPLQTYHDTTNLSGFFRFEGLPGTHYEVRVELTDYSTYQETLRLPGLSLPYYIHLTRAFRNITGAINISGQLRFGLSIEFINPNDEEETYSASIFNDEYEIREIAISDGILRVTNEGRLLLQEQLQFNEEDTLEYDINLEHFITVTGELDLDPVFTAYPLYFHNIETNEEFRAYVNYGDYHYIVELPAGTYDIRLGPMTLDTDVFFDTPVDSFDLGFEFDF